MEKLQTLRVVRGYGLKFVWYGGSYIDVSFAGDENSFDVINTEKADGTRVPFTRENFRSLVTDYIGEANANDLREYRMAQ